MRRNLVPLLPLLLPLPLSLPMNGRGGVKLATIIEQQGCEVRDDSQRVSSGDDVPEPSENLEYDFW